MSCPQLHLTVSSISEPKAKEIGKKQKSMLDSNYNTFEKIEGVFKKMQNAIDNGDTYTNTDDFDTLFIFSRESYTSIEENVYENKLTNKNDRAYWVYFEIFSDQVFNDVVVNMDFEDKKFSKTTSLEQKLNSGKTDELLRGQKGLHVFSMVMSYQDTYDVRFLSRNAIKDITGFDDQLKHVIFQMKVYISPIGKTSIPLTMTSLLPPSFDNLRDLGIVDNKNNELNYVRERLLFSTKDTNEVKFTISKPSKARLFLKSLITGVSIKAAYIKDSSGNKVTGNIVEKSFNELDIGYNLENSGSYTLTIVALSKKKKFADFFMKFEVEHKISRSKCDSENIPKFDDIAITAKRSEATQETHYYVGNNMFRNIYHLGQKQVGSPTEIFKLSLPGDDNRNYKVIPFSLKAASNLVTVNLFHDFAEDLLKLYIIGKSEDPKDLFDLIRDQKKTGDHSNVPDVESIYQSKTLQYFDGIEKQFIPKGDYQLVIMNMDPQTDSGSRACVLFTMSIYVEEELKKSDSKKKSGMLVSSSDQIDDGLDESVIESMTLCQSGFVFDKIFVNPLKVNGGYLSIDSIYRFDNDEKDKKRIILEVNTNSVIYVKATDIYDQMQELEMSLNVMMPNQKNPTNEIVKAIVSKKADKESELISEKYVELQKFVKSGKYQIDLSKSVFEVDTDLFPCSRLRLELEVRPLNDLPEILKDGENCEDEKASAATIKVNADPSSYDKWTRVDSLFPVTSAISKTFNFKISEPTFLIFLTNFEKEISGGSLAIAVSHVINYNKDTLGKSKKGKNNLLPLYYSTDTLDGTSFIHHRLDPYLSG